MLSLCLMRGWLMVELTEAHNAISAALQVFPHLTACGIAARPCAPLDPARVAVAIEFLKSCTHSAKRACSSYELKHMIEVCGGYVANGEAICAAVWLGYRMQPIPGTPNCSVHVVIPAEVEAAIARCRERRR